MLELKIKQKLNTTNANEKNNFKRIEVMYLQ